MARSRHDGAAALSPPCASRQASTAASVAPSNHAEDFRATHERRARWARRRRSAAASSAARRRAALRLTARPPSRRRPNG